MLEQLTNKVQLKQIQLLHKGSINTPDLLNNGFESLEIFTSLYSPFIRMIITFNDVYDFFKNIKFIGDEEFNIELYDNLNQKTYTFAVDVNSPKINGERNTFDKKATVVFECVSQDCYDAHRVISKAFTGSGSKIVTDIVSKNFLTNDYVIEDTTSLNFTSTNPYQSNYKNGLQIINYLAENDYAFFYQDLDEKYYYKKAETILNGTPISGEIKFTSNQIEYLNPNNPSKYQFNNFFNNELLLKFGCLNTRYENISGTSYQINKKEQKIGDLISSDNFGKGNFFDYIDESISRVSQKYGNIENRLNREMLIKQLESYEMIIQSETNLARRIGNIVTLNYTGFDNNNEKHPLYDGNWLITSIKNSIAKNISKQTIHISKVKFSGDR